MKLTYGFLLNLHVEFKNPIRQFSATVGCHRTVLFYKWETTSVRQPNKASASITLKIAKLKKVKIKVDFSRMLQDNETKESQQTKEDENAEEEESSSSDEEPVEVLKFANKLFSSQS